MPRLAFDGSSRRREHGRPAPANVLTNDALDRKREQLTRESEQVAQALLDDNKRGELTKHGAEVLATALNKDAEPVYEGDEITTSSYEAAGNRVRETKVKAVRRKEIDAEQLALVFWLQAKRKIRERREQEAAIDQGPAPEPYLDHERDDRMDHPMTDQDPAMRVRSLIEGNSHMTLATVDEQGKPRVSPVFYAFDDDYALYWVSSKSAQHSSNIRNHPEVDIVIYNTEGGTDALYIEAEAAELSNHSDVERAAEVMKRRPQDSKFEIKSLDDVTGDAAWRIYRALPKALYLREEGKENGQTVTRRSPVLGVLEPLEPENDAPQAP